MNMYQYIENGFADYNNWRYMKNEILKPSIHYSLTDMCKAVERRLVVLLGNYYLVSFPNMTILKYINSNEGKGEMMSAHGRHPEYCKECYGAGKFDWVSNATGPNRFHSRYEFVRDKNYVLLYHKPNGEISKNNVWAPTEVHKGERICDTCLGTGISLDSYPRLNNIKNSLVLYDIRYLLT